MSLNYRCTRRSCRKRVSIRVGKAPGLCPSCGGHLSLDLEPKRRNKRNTCTCCYLPFPHCRGTLGCSYGPAMDEDDYRALIRNLQLPAHKRVNF